MRLGFFNFVYAHIHNKNIIGAIRYESAENCRISHFLARIKLRGKEFNVKK